MIPPAVIYLPSALVATDFQLLYDGSNTVKVYTVGVIEEEAEDAVELPDALLATTVKVYAVPLVKPVTLALVPELTVAVNPPGLEVTVYPVMAEPPSKGAVQETVASPFPFVAVTPVGAPGMVTGVTEEEAEDADELPAAFIATTVKVYAVPFDSPVTVAVVPVTVAVNPPGLDVTVYPVMVEPPLLAGAAQETVA